MSANSSTSLKFLNKPEGLGAKRRRLQNGEYVHVGPIDVDPQPCLEHHQTHLHYKISPTELLTAPRSIISQVNWSDVVLDVVGRERPALYRDAFEKILRLHVEELLKPGGIDERRRNNHEDEDQRSSSTIKGTEEIASGLLATSSVEAEHSTNVAEKDDNESFVDIVNKNAVSERFEKKMRRIGRRRTRIMMMMMRMRTRTRMRVRMRKQMRMKWIMEEMEKRMMETMKRIKFRFIV